ncbi:MAG: hypothetical protein R2838_13870 [Caldilineaceae bacterium]
MQALLAAGETVDGPGLADGRGQHARRLPARHAATTVSLRGRPAMPSLLATQQAIPALLGHTFPLMDVFAPTPGVDLCRGAYLPIALPGQNAP